MEERRSTASMLRRISTVGNYREVMGYSPEEWRVDINTMIMNSVNIISSKSEFDFTVKLLNDAPIGSVIKQINHPCMIEGVEVVRITEWVKTEDNDWKTVSVKTETK